MRLLPWLLLVSTLAALALPTPASAQLRTPREQPHVVVDLALRAHAAELEDQARGLLVSGLSFVLGGVTVFGAGQALTLLLVASSGWYWGGESVPVPGLWLVALPIAGIGALLLLLGAGVEVAAALARAEMRDRERLRVIANGAGVALLGAF